MGIVATLTIARTWYDYGNGEPPCGVGCDRLSGQSAVLSASAGGVSNPCYLPPLRRALYSRQFQGTVTDLRHRSEDIEDDVPRTLKSLWELTRRAEVIDVPRMLVPCLSES